MSEIETAVLDYEKPAATLQQDADFKKKSPTKTSTAISQDVLRQCAWEIGESKPAEAYQPGANHAGLTMVSPGLGFAHWRICSGWIDQVEREKGDYWNNCRMLLRLYDVSWIEFNGFNAHCIEDHELPEICGRRFFPINRPGSWQIAEIGFLLRTGEFIPAARSNVVRFSPISSSSRHDQAGLLVEDGHVEEVGNVWDQERILNERRRPKLRPGLRIATLAFSSRVSGQADDLSDFVSELAARQCAKGHRVHVFVPAQNEFHQPCEVNGVHYEPIGIPLDLPPIEQAQSYAQAIKERLQDFDSFDLVHAHEWMAAAAANHFNATRVLSLSSIEKERRNGSPSDSMSQEIEAYERNMAQKADCLLVPANVRDRMVKELDADETKVFGFPMQGRLPDEWECPLDFGQVKKDIGFGPLDRLLLFVGPLEHATGVDLLLEALPILLGRADNIRFALVGEGDMHSHLEHHMHHLGVSHAIRLLGHVEGDFLTKLVRSAEALVLPSRFRVPMDDAVVDLARRGGRPVITTHGGPAHLIHHEETGIITYDNPGSIVWAVDRIISDPFHADQMGRNGKRSENSMPNWEEVGRRYLEICATNFPSLRRDSSDKQGTPSEGKVSAETIPDRDAVPARPEHPQAEQSPPHYGKAPFQGYQAPPAEEREITPSNVPTVQEEPTEQENPERVDEFAEPQDFSENNETPTAEQPLPQVESVAVETQPSPDESFQQESPQEDDSQGLPPLYHEVSPQVDEATSKISDMHKEWEEQGTSQQPEKVELPPAIVETTKEQLVVAAFCFESPDSPVGQYVANELAGLTRRGVEVHLFSRRPFVVEEPNLKNYAVSCDEKAEYLDQVEEFTSHASNRFMQRFPTGLGNLILLGHEWSTIPALSMLHGLKNLTTVLSLHSLERQRSDLSSDTSRKIDEIERTGLREARSIVIHNEATRKVVSEWSHEWDGKLVNAYPRFPTETFASDLDAGEVKASYEIGPVDPLILYNGDFSQRYGPDLLVKAMPAILKNHPQARLVLLGYGEEYWPLRVYVRYLLLEHAIRIPGSIEGPELQELIRAADIIAVPSREPTPWWPIQAAWAAQRPILATHDAAPDLLEHEKDSVLCYSSVNSCVWGIERLLFDEKLRATLGKNGNRKLKARFGWDQVAEHLEEHLRSAIRK